MQKEIEIVEIAFQEKGRIYYFDSNNYKLKPNISVVVETEHGLQVGQVIKGNAKINCVKIKQGLKKVLRVANKNDIKKHNQNQKECKEAIKKCKELVLKHKLNMQIIDATYTLNKEKLIFRFLSDGRVDFRELAKDLARNYKTRIELRQIGARDKAKEKDGYGACGQRICCSRFLKELDTVSMNMAKNQNIALNPSKINGLCGRLLCCFKYEDEFYTCTRKKLKKIGDKIQTEKGEGEIIGLDILKQQYKVQIPNHGIVMVDKN